MAIITEDSYYVLRYNPQAVAAAANNKDLVLEDGIEDAFDVNSDRFRIPIDVLPFLSRH